MVYKDIWWKKLCRILKVSTEKFFALKLQASSIRTSQAGLKKRRIAPSTHSRKNFRARRLHNDKSGEISC
jgi:hypothetical protein